MPHKKFLAVTVKCRYVVQRGSVCEITLTHIAPLYHIIVLCFEGDDWSVCLEVCEG